MQPEIVLSGETEDVEMIERRTNDAKWREDIATQIRDMQGAHQTMTSEINGLRDGQDAIIDEIAANTAITTEARRIANEARDLLLEHAKKIAPMVAGWDRLESGVAIMGKIGTGGATAGRWAVKMFRPVLYLIAFWVFVKALLSGASFDAACAAFLRILEGK